MMSAMESSARRCYVHVGLPKTGTSFLQNKLWLSGESLAARDISMLPTRRPDHHRVARALRGLVDEQTEGPSAVSALERLAQEAADTPTRHALLSQEALAPATADQVGRLVDILAGFEVHVIVTARDIARALPSAWQQRIRSRYTFSYDEFLDSIVHRRPATEDVWHNQDLADVVERWSSHVPAERLHLVTVPGVGTPQSSSLLDRFCTTLGVTPDDLATAEVPAGESLGRAQAELLRRTNLALGDRLPDVRSGYHRVGRAFLAGQVLRPQGGERILMPARLQHWCQKTAEDWIAKLSTGGYDVVGSLDDLLPHPDSFTDEAGDVPAEQMVDSAAAALAEILVIRAQELEEVHRLRARNASLRRRLRAAEETARDSRQWQGLPGRALGRARRAAQRRRA